MDRMLLTGVRLYEKTSTTHLVCTRWCVLLQKGSLHQENKGMFVAGSLTLDEYIDKIAHGLDSYHIVVNVC